MKNLNISVANKVATYCQRDGFIVCGNSDYQITFTFDSDWDGYTNKIARFKWNGGHKDVKIEDGNTAAVPRIENATQVEVGVYVGDLSTTTPAVIPCTRSILCGSSTTEYLTPEDVSSLEERLLAACKFYRHRYATVVGTFGARWAEVEFIVFSTSTETLENRSDFLKVLKSGIYKTPFIVWLMDAEGFGREGTRVVINDSGKIDISYNKVDTSDTGWFYETRYTVNSVEITEA